MLSIGTQYRRNRKATLHLIGIKSIEDIIVINKFKKKKKTEHILIQNMLGKKRMISI